MTSEGGAPVNLLGRKWRMQPPWGLKQQGCEK